MSFAYVFEVPEFRCLPKWVAQLKTPACEMHQSPEPERWVCMLQVDGWRDASDWKDAPDGNGDVITAEKAEALGPLLDDLFDGPTPAKTALLRFYAKDEERHGRSFIEFHWNTLSEPAVFAVSLPLTKRMAAQERLAGDDEAEAIELILMDEDPLTGFTPVVPEGGGAVLQMPQYLKRSDAAAWLGERFIQAMRDGSADVFGKRIQRKWKKVKDMKGRQESDGLPFGGTIEENDLIKAIAGLTVRNVKKFPPRPPRRSEILSLLNKCRLAAGEKEMEANRLGAILEKLGLKWL